MRKLLIAIIVAVMFVPFMAQAFTVPEEVQVMQPPAEQSVAQAVPAVSNHAPVRTNDKTYKAVKSLDRKLVGKKGMLTNLREKINGFVTSITGAKTAADNATTAANAAKKSADDAKVAVTALDKKLTDEKTGEFKKLNDTAWSVGNELSKDMVKYFLMTAALIIGLGVFIFFLIRETNKLVEDSSKKTADEVKKLDPIVIELNDVAGHRVKYTVPIVDNMYVTCYVPSTVTSPVANPAQIVPIRMTDRGAVRKSVRKTMADYFTKLAANTNPATEQDRQQKALIEHLIATGTIVVG